MLTNVDNNVLKDLVPHATRIHKLLPDVQSERLAFPASLWNEWLLNSRVFLVQDTEYKLISSQVAQNKTKLPDGCVLRVVFDEYVLIPVI